MARQRWTRSDWWLGLVAVTCGMTPFLGWYRAGPAQELCDRVLGPYDVPAGAGRCHFGGAQTTDLWAFPGRAATLLAASLAVAFLAPREPERFQVLRALAVAVLVVTGLRGVVAQTSFDSEVNGTYTPLLGAWTALALTLVAGALWLHGEADRLRAAGQRRRPHLPGGGAGDVPPPRDQDLAQDHAVRSASTDR